MRVLVLGSSGRLGQALKQVVLQEGERHSFIFSTREDTNLLEAGEVVDIFNAVAPGIVVNLAAEVTVSISSAKNDFDVFSRNVLVNQNVLAASFSAKVSNLIQVGTYHSFSSSLDAPFSSRHAPSFSQLNFASSYGASKAVELMAAQMSNCNKGSPTSVSVVCMPNLYGPYGPKSPDKEHLIGAIIRRVLSAQAAGEDEIQATGNPSELREYVYTIDAAMSLFRKVQDVGLNGVYSVVSSGEVLSISDCWRSVADVLGYSGQLNFQSDRLSSERNMYFDQKTIDPTPFQTALAQTISWYKRSLSSEDN